MSIGDVNTELQCLGNEHASAVIDAMYDDMVDELNAMFDMNNYAAASYDADAIYYGSV